MLLQLNERTGTNMASMMSNQKITTNAIINDFVLNVINRITANTYDVSTIFRSGNTGVYVVDPAYLDSLRSIPLPNIGYTGMKISAYNSDRSITYLSIYNAFMYITKYLLKIGGFKYTEYKLSDHGNLNLLTHSGKAIFSDQVIFDNLHYYNINNATLAGDNYPASSGGVSEGNKISINSLNTLMNLCVSMWMNSNKVLCTSVKTYCYDDCHSDCDTYVDNCYSGPCNDPYDNANCYGNGSYVCGDAQNQGYTCNENSYDGECHSDSGGGGSKCHTDSTVFTIHTGDPMVYSR